MNDNISRQKLYKAISDGDYTTGNIFKDMELQQFIKDQPPADQWIPCSEGTLPANGRTVPVTNEVSQGKRYMTTATYYTKKGFVDDYEWTGEGFYQYDSEYGYGRLHNVVAWLNVEPYKGVE